MKIVKVGSRPSSGIWYYVWDGGAWELMVWKTHEAFSGHPEAWEAAIAPELAKKLGLDARKARELAEIPYCMPRGRAVMWCSLDRDVILFNIDAAGTPELLANYDYDWRLYHGGDFPSGLNREAEERRLVSAFDLTGPLIRGKAKFEVVPHEAMLPAHRAKFEELTGLKVPW